MPIGPRQLRRFQLSASQLRFRHAALGTAAADLRAQSGTGGLLFCWPWPDRRRDRCGSAARIADGLVVQGVLLTVLVTAIGLLAIASRVASSREGAAAGSLAAAARQAAEFGFTEIVAEMNRDSKSYLWVTPYTSWNSVSDADLRACGIHASGAPAANPIEGASNSTTTSKALPGSDQLSYSLTDFQAPASLSPRSTCTNFGNPKGGTATFTVVGTARRGTGDTTTYTLKRSVSVRRAEPVFRRTIFQAPASQANLAASDPRFPTFPTAATLGVAVNSGPPVLTCALATPDSAGGSKYTCNGQSFDNSLFKFPYTSSGVLATGCSPNPANTQIVCQFSSLTLLGTTAPSVGVQMVVDVATRPVTIFVNDPLNSPVTISANANLCSDSPPSPSSPTVTSCLGTAATTSPPAAATPPATGNWSRLRLFGNALPTSSAPCNQPIQLNTSPDNSTIPVNRLNLQNAFLWFPAATLTYPSLTALPSGLVGWVCSIGAPASNATVASLTPNQVFDGLGDESNGGIFLGGANQPEKIRFVYRGYGSQEQQP